MNICTLTENELLSFLNDLYWQFPTLALQETGELAPSGGLKVLHEFFFTLINMGSKTAFQWF